jgi:hypothetical protein
MEKRAAISGEDRLIKQYFCLFGIPDDYGTVPVKGCFKKSIDERGPLSDASYKITVLNQHDQKNPLCKPSVLIEDQFGLYGEYTPDEGIGSNDVLVKRIKNGTINNGSYGFNYVWDKMEYDDETGLIMMFECNLFEVSPVTIGSQTGTFVKRSSNGIFEDETLEDETEGLIKAISKKYQLQIRSLINRHISLAKLGKPTNESLTDDKPTKAKLDLNYLLKKF